MGMCMALGGITIKPAASNYANICVSNGVAILLKLW